ncbi:TnsA endonuclease N-terminal domain-containing protein [Lignipirellula cremea]|uniref:TnsA endonuclease N-terminal domain-containing protein n=1 Tax=Lignipirellula cremea TaxID=2528010 RepID=UPI00119E1715|nr:TnsA endonuclease N-terminal domain-containing protein [Lignipirellula cremea]
MPPAADHEPPSTFHLRRRTPGSFLLVPCPQIGRAIRCQGQLEAAAAVILVGCPLVSSILEQPLSIWYAWREQPAGVQIQLLDQSPRRRRIGVYRVSYITPDFLVEMREGRKRLVEVKPSGKLARPDVQRKLAVAQAYAAAQGWTFHVVTELHLLPCPLLSNLRLISRYRQAQADPKAYAALLERIADGPLSLRELLHHSCERETTLHLLANGRLDWNPVTAPFAHSTLLYPGGTLPWDPFDSVWASSGCWTVAPSGSSVKRPPTSSSPAT